MTRRKAAILRPTLSRSCVDTARQRKSAVAPRKRRTPVVLDTNVIVGQLLSKTRHSANARVYDLWLVRRELQLIVSPPILEEYLELLERLGPRSVDKGAGRLRERRGMGKGMAMKIG